MEPNYWRTDGTAAGTALLKDINPGPGHVYSFLNFPFYFHFNNKLFFIANNGTQGNEIWSTDGTTANTVILKDIQTSPAGSTSIFNAIIVGNKFFFTSSDFATRFEMWQSDGTTAGTVLFKSFAPADVSGSPLIMPPFLFDYLNGANNQALFQGNKFFFTAGTVDEGVELWVSDGTLANTVMVKNIGPGDANGVQPSSYAYTSNYFYFPANDGVNGNELWKSDGTGPGTSMVANINPGAEEFGPGHITHYQ